MPPIYIFCIFPSFNIRCHDKCNGGYTPKLKPMRGARRRARYLSTGVWQASRQTGLVSLPTMLLSLPALGSAPSFCIIIYIEQDSFQRSLSPSRAVIIAIPQ